VIKYNDIDDAVRRANHDSRGLSGSVWGTDIAKATAVAARLECGTAWVNQHSSQPTANSVHYPFGGFKQSGMGRERGRLGLLAYSQSQVINVLKRVR
jgi:acyl-CoA reductase-like NAD-dependent aldehyde dehydrogenase